MIAHSQPIALPAAGSSLAAPGAGSASSSGAGDYTMHDVGSYPGSSSDGVFNPASFTRHFLGSPISWRAMSWGMSPSARGGFPAGFPAGSPTAALLSTIDLNEYRAGKNPSSVESDSIMNALNVFEREGELCRNYTCCGLHLTDLHALLEHFEEVHIVVLDPQSAAPQAHIQIPFNPTAHPLPQNNQNASASTSAPHANPYHPSHQHQNLQSQNPNQSQNGQNSQYPPQHLQSQSTHPHPLHQHHQPTPYNAPFDPDDMELDDVELDVNLHPSPSGSASIPAPPPPSAQSSTRSSPSSCGGPGSRGPSSCAPSPPDTPISTPLSAWPSPRGAFALPYAQHHTSFLSQPPSPLGSAYPPSSTAASTRHSSPVRSEGGSSEGSSHLGASHGAQTHNQAQTHTQTQRPSLNLNLALAPGTAFAPPLGRGGRDAPLANAGSAFNAYARFASDYSACMPGAQFNGATVDEASAIRDGVQSNPNGSNKPNTGSNNNHASANGNANANANGGGADLWSHPASAHMWAQGHAMGGLGTGFGASIGMGGLGLGGLGGYSNISQTQTGGLNPYGNMNAGHMEDGGGCVPPALLFASGSPKSEEGGPGVGVGKVKGRGKGSNANANANANAGHAGSGHGHGVNGHGHGHGHGGRKAQTAPATPVAGVVHNPFNSRTPGAAALQGHLQSALGGLNSPSANSSVSNLNGSQSPSSQHPSSSNTNTNANGHNANLNASSSNAHPSSSSSTTPASLARAAASPLLMSKPFRCPKPNCNKSYKQANGLKYHMTHGSCNFAPPKDLEHVKDLLERKRRERERDGGSNGVVNGGAQLMRSASTGSGMPSAYASSSTAPSGVHVNGANAQNATNMNANDPPPTPLSPTSILSLTPADLSNISESDLVEVEREAERRLRPFACGVGECTRRYKNMNGLRYHYQHSGDHGAVGLALLASGVHECLGGKRGSGASGHAGPGQSGMGLGLGLGGGGGQGGYGLGGGGGSVQSLRQGGVKGSASMPVSRASSMSVTPSRAGTPAPVGMQGQQSHAQAQQTAQAQFAVQAAAYAHQQAQAQAQHQAQAQAQAQVQAQAQSQQQWFPMAGMNANGMTGGGMQQLKTTAITPTTAPTVHARAFVVPVSNAASSSSASSSASASNVNLNASAGVGAQTSTAAATANADGTSSHSRNNSNGNGSRPGSAGGYHAHNAVQHTLQHQQQPTHLAHQQHPHPSLAHAHLGPQQGHPYAQHQGYGLPANAMLNSPLTGAEGSPGAAPTSPNGNGNASGAAVASTSSTTTSSGLEASSADFAADDALMGSFALGSVGAGEFGMDMGTSPVKRAVIPSSVVAAAEAAARNGSTSPGREGVEIGEGEEQDAARAAALYARQQHAAAAMGMGMGMDM